MTKKKLFDEPASQEREYVRLLVAFAKGLAADVRKVVIPSLRPLIDEHDANMRGDSWVDTLAELLIELEAMASQRSAVIFSALPGRFEAVSAFNDGQFKMIVKANTGIQLPDTGKDATAMMRALGVNVYRDEPYLATLKNAWVRENVALVKSIPEKLHGDLRGIIDRGVTNGMSVKQIQADIVSRFGVTKSRAKLIAQDQTLKANAALTRERLKSVGVEEYIWRTVNDARVRPAHAEREGVKYRWDNPPSDGHPGTPVRCRCRSEAVWPEE